MKLTNEQWDLSQSNKKFNRSRRDEKRSNLSGPYSN